MTRYRYDCKKKKCQGFGKYVFKAKCGNVLVTHGDKIPDAKLLKEASGYCDLP